jgi:DNA-binding Lrp family transcriptional regulator
VKRPNLITFESVSDQSAIILARIGQGNREIARQTGLSGNQINYRLRKAKDALEQDSGFRVNWRNGKDPLVGRILKDYSSIMAAEIERKIVPKIAKPEARVVKIKN